MKYALLVGDGMADFPIPELDNRTPLEYARTPGMDAVAACGRVGRVKTIPDGMQPGSDVANMSLMGYDPAVYYRGRGRAPLEAASMGLKLSPRDTALRCNLVCLRDGTMADFSAGHIETADAHEIVAELAARLDSPSIKLHPGVSYRHILIVTDFPPGELDCTPPHDISDRDVAPYLPKGAGQEMLLDLMDTARGVLASSPVNQRRRAAGKTPATDIWLWGHGTAITLPTFEQRFGLRGSVVSAVDLVRGIGALAGLTVREVAGATGYLGTNYAGKVAAAAAALASQDFVFVHVEAPDETSHEGSLDKKIQAIEEFDRHVVGEVLKLRDQHPDLRIMVLPDHATPLSLKTHHPDPVPFAVCGNGISAGSVATYSEKSAAGGALYSGASLFEEFVHGDF